MSEIDKAALKGGVSNPSFLMKPDNDQNKIVVYTSKLELEGSMSLAASYRFTLALLGDEARMRIDSGETNLQAEIAKLDANPELMEKLSSDLINRILTSNDPNFRQQIIDILDAVFGEVPEEHFVELETDTPRIRNRKRNNQINTIVAIFEAMRAQRLRNADDDQEGGDDAELSAEGATAETQTIDVESSSEGEESASVAAGIPEPLAQVGAVNLDALPPDLQEAVLKAIDSGKQVASSSKKHKK